MRLRTLAVTGGALALAAATAAGAWLGLQPATAESTGSCAAAYYELSAEREDGLIEVEFELTSNTPGEVWALTVAHDDTVLLETEHTTDAEAELDVDLERQPTGEDTFTVTATPEGGDPCVAAVSHD